MKKRNLSFGTFLFFFFFLEKRDLRATICYSNICVYQTGPSRGCAGWFKVRFRIHQCRGRFYTRFAGGSRVRALLVHVARVRKRDISLVLPFDTARRTIISNKSLPLDVLSAVLSAFQRKKMRYLRTIISLPFDTKMMHLMRFVSGRDK